MMTSMTEDPRGTVLELLRTMKPPVHVAVLALEYKKRSGRSIKQVAKRGMLQYLKTDLKSEVVVMGEGNDAFVRLSTPVARAVHWIRGCIEENGPILASMVGRLYLEAHGKPFAENGFPEGIGRFMRDKLADELQFETQKGQEILVDAKRRGDPRGFLNAASKKQRKKAPDKSGSGNAQQPETLLPACRLADRGWKMVYGVPTERVLVVGEADFSWSASLVHLPEAPGAPVAPETSKRRRRLTCTSFDSLATVRAKYGSTVDRHIASLRACGASVLHDVDATSLAALKPVRSRGPFDLVAFHFPHVGGDGGLASSIEENRLLLCNFLRGIGLSDLLADDGEV